jgi:peptide/nickel transport system permease protein/oligopeptide transport system permease protein
MTGYLARCVIAGAITLLVISSIIFLMIRFLPGDPARVIAGEMATEQDVALLRARLNLDKPLTVQYGIFLRELIHGDLGTSARTQLPVAEEVFARLPRTIRLATVSMLIATLLGVPAGLAAAFRRYSIFDLLVSFGTLCGVSMPVYWLGLMLIVLFAVKLGWLPAAGADSLTSVILPGITLAMYSIGLITRMTRASTLDVLCQDYIRTARAKGLPGSVLVYRHVLRNVLIPVITTVGLQFGALLGGAVLTESVFGWPGMGLLLVDSIFSRDYPMIQGVVLVFSALVISMNLLVDVSYGYIDPRIRYS